MATELLDIAYALGVGVLVGTERQHRVAARDPTRAENTPLGVRTFALLALLGWLTGYLAGELPWLVPAVAGFAALLLFSQHHFYHRSERTGVTTELAAVLTLLLGMLVAEDRLLAAVIAVVATTLLISKSWVGSVVGHLRRVELRGTLQLLIAVAIVIPVLPAEARDPWEALPPRAIGLFVVLIAGLNYVGYFLSRILGKERGVGITGAVGGITSSTAVTAAMAQAVSRDPALRATGQMAVFFANAMSLARVFVLAIAVSRETAMAILPPLGAMGLIMLAFALYSLSRSGLRGDEAEGPELENPFALVPALKWGALLCAILLASEIASDYTGDEGLIAVAAVSGLADVSPVTLAAARQAAAGEIASWFAALAILTAVTANFVVKGAIAALGAGLAFAKPVIASLAAASAVGVTVLLLV